MNIVLLAVAAVGLSVNGNEATITVPEGVASDGDTLFLCYGDRDYGDAKADWPNAVLVTNNLTASGGMFSLEIPEREKYPIVSTRAFVLGPKYLAALRANRAYIDLQETPALDRRYEFRFTYDPYGSSDAGFFGGVSRSGTTQAFQLYCAQPPRMWKFFVSTAADDIIELVAPVGTTVYDVKVEVEKGEQRVYWKTADAAEYTLAGTRALESIPYTGNLYLLARNDCGTAVFAGDEKDSQALFYGYKVTELSTGKVLKNLVPAMDEDGNGYMIDIANDNAPYRKSGVGTLKPEIGYGPQVAASEAASSDGCYVTVKSAAKVRITVMPVVSDGESALYLVWGKEDAGDRVPSWEHCHEVAAAVPAEGAVYDVSTAGLAIGKKDVLRAVLVPIAHICRCCGAGRGEYIDLGNAVADRQIDLRFQGSPLDSAFWGGLVRGSPNKILQLYVSKSDLNVWLGDATSYKVVTLGSDESSVLRDVRLILKDGEQKAYYKPADEDEFGDPVATASVAAIPTNVKLALCGRYDGSSASGSANMRFARYTETQISTGTVLKDYVPVHKDNLKLVYDRASNTEVSIAGDPANFVYTEDTAETQPLFTRPKTATPLFTLPTGGFAVLIQ